MLLSLSNISNVFQTGHFPIFSLFWWPFIVTITTVKVKFIPDFYVWAIVLINQQEENGDWQLLFFGLIGGSNWFLNACSSFQTAIFAKFVVTVKGHTYTIFKNIIQHVQTRAKGLNITNLKIGPKGGLCSLAP